jgi:ABC-type nickel/cobalt efflux system permease component RcnA
MNQPLLLSILLAGFTVAFFHTAIPTHWLPFALTGRAQGWSSAKTLTITGLAALGHTGFTTVLGVLVAFLGMTVDRWTGQIFPWIAGGFLFAVGIFFLIRQAMGNGGVHFLHGHGHAQEHDHSHGHDHVHDHSAGHTHEHEHAVPLIAEEHDFSKPISRVSDRAAIVGLLALLTFSPCEGFLPIYVSAVRLGWAGFAFSSVVLAAATVGGMITFTSLTLAGLNKVRLAAIENYESGILGTVLCILAVVIILLEG